MKSPLNLSLALASSLCVQSLLLAAASAPTVVEEFNRPFLVMLKDAGHGEGRWEFPLPAAGNDFVMVWPRDGAALAEPNAIGKDGKRDLAKLRQLQLIGVYLEMDTGRCKGDPNPTGNELLPGASVSIVCRLAMQLF